MYEFLAKECTTKILAGHRITSPLLFGIRGDGSGFGNNAEELRDAFSLFQNTVVKPYQRTLLDGLQVVFYYQRHRPRLLLQDFEACRFYRCGGG